MVRLLDTMRYRGSSCMRGREACLVDWGLEELLDLQLVNTYNSYSRRNTSGRSSCWP